MDQQGRKPVLIALSGLPGVGKTTIARLVAARLGATYLRIDTAEQALARSGEIADRVIVSGYLVCYALAVDNLRLGHSVLADSVNPIPITRNAWRDVAEKADARFIAVELTCSDREEHRRRVQTRQADIAGHLLPDWQAVFQRQYESWAEADLVVDTGRTRVEDAVAEIVAYIGKNASSA
jgi:predicted kinase